MNINRLLILWFLLPVTICAQENTLYVTGNLSTKEKSTSQQTTLFVKGNVVVDGNNTSIEQNGYTTLTGDFINNVTGGNVFNEDNTGLVEFGGYEIQYIRGSANKATHYIDFPDVRINNSASVRIASSMGIRVRNLDLAEGRLVLESDLNETNPRNVESAHLFVKTDGSVIYNRDAETIDEQGIIQVNLALGDNYQNGNLVGFSPPFKRIYSDYFTFNYLSKPSPTGLFGDSQALITDLSSPLNAGEGFIVGQGIISDEDYYAYHLGQQWSESDYNDRYTTEFSFARNYIPNSFGQYNIEADRFTGEEINISDVSVSLDKTGFNYVGNPFTTPIDLASFVQETTTADEWGVTRSADGTGEVRNSFYVISGGTGTYNEDTKRYRFTVSYLLGQAVGETLNAEASPSLEIAPMQLFIIGKNANGVSNFTIPASARSHGPAPFLRSAPQYVDELMIESRDSDTQAYDRLCVVFREGANLHSGDKYDAAKLFNYSGGVSQIYTLSSNGKEMTTNVISPETNSIDLYVLPSDTEKQVSLKAYRLQSIQSVTGVWLEDKQTSSITDLMINPEYTFLSHPEDNPNRFRLYFSEPTNIRQPQASSIYAFYHANAVYVRGLSEVNRNDFISLSDMQGRTLYKGRIEDIPEVIINRYLTKGIYIINTTGQQHTVTKMVVK